MIPARFVISIGLLLLAPSLANAEWTVDFDELTPTTPNATGEGNYFDGYGASAVSGSWSSGGVTFTTNSFGPGWSYSNVNDTATGEFTNQWAAITGSGFGGVGNYALASGYKDVVVHPFNAEAFDPLNRDHLFSIPYFETPSGFMASSMRVTNTTYAHAVMANGDAFAKKFGGLGGADEDYLLLSAYGVDSEGNPLGISAEFYLADFRFADNALDYIVNTWEMFDLSPLAAAKTIHFNLTSSDLGAFGMNTPGYFAVDNLILTAVPEPGSLAMLVAVGFLAASRVGRVIGDPRRVRRQFTGRGDHQ